MNTMHKTYFLEGISKRESKIESMEKQPNFNPTQGTLFLTLFLPLFHFYFTNFHIFILTIYFYFYGFVEKSLAYGFEGLEEC